MTEKQSCSGSSLSRASIDQSWQRPVYFSVKVGGGKGIQELGGAAAPGDDSQSQSTGREKW
jgi:hypothetical protein